MPKYYDPILCQTEDLSEAEAVDRPDLRPATEYETHRTEQEATYGGAGQVAQGLAEKAVPGLRFVERDCGIGDEADQRARAQYLEREHPVASVAAETAPQLALAMLGGSLAAGGAPAAP